MSLTRSLLVIPLHLSLSLLVFSQTVSQHATRSQESSRTGSEFSPIYGQASVEWPAPVPDGALLLTVSGPAQLYTRQEYPAGHWPRFSLTDEQGQPRPDGVYKWELIVQAEREVRDQINPRQSGWFQIRAGRVVAEGTVEKQPATVEDSAPANSLYIDSQGRVGLGTSVPASQLHVKGKDPAFMFEDTTTGGGAFTFRALETGDDSLGLFDNAGKTRWLVDSQGRMGINTTKLTSALTVDGYIEASKGFLINGRPLGGIAFFGSAQPFATEGSSNNFFGSGAGTAIAGGSDNSFFGASSGTSDTSGSRNSFFGAGAGYSCTIASDNSFFGNQAGYLNTAISNSFFGSGAGRFNTNGSSNSFFGTQAGYFNETGSYNSFFGRDSGQQNTSGRSNTFFGANSGQDNLTGSYNSFFGEYTGYKNTTGTHNSAYGVEAGVSNTTEENNTFVGAYADLAPGLRVDNATALGARAYVAQANSLVLGSIPNVNFGTSYVNVGIGTTTPARQLHLAGPNAVFRMDRTTDTASFILVRTDPTGATPWKTFVVGTNATGVNQGEFIINDIGAAVGGGGNRRMTITSDGNVEFTGSVSAASFVQTSSAAFKTNIRTYENALETVNRLRGVRFDWKDSGKPAVGLIAEEVNEVVPEVVAHDENGKAKGVNYANLVAVLVEAVKEQQATIQDQHVKNEELQTMLKQQQAELDNLKGLKAKVERLEALLQAR